MKIITIMIVMLSITIWGNISSAAPVCKATQLKSTPTADFMVNGDGTVTHTKTGLMWKQCSEGFSDATCSTGAVTRLTWQAALQHVASLNTGAGFATYADWRLPNIKELSSITEDSCYGAAVNDAVFPDTFTLGTGSYSRSSTPNVTTPANAWGINFSSGAVISMSKTATYSFRLVRGGQ
jgi:hypothetical protein